MTTKQLDIKNRTYHFYNDLINLPNFSMNNLKLDKKHGKTLIFTKNNFFLYFIKINLKIGV